MTEREHNEPLREPLWKRPGTEPEDAFQAYIEASEPYVAKIEDDGDTAWFNDPAKVARLGVEAAGLDARRELFMRRYIRPAPPEGLLTDPRRPEGLVTAAVRQRERISSLPPINDTEDAAA